MLNKPVFRKNCKFQEDPLIAGHLRSGLKDYFGSGYQRGHMAAANHPENVKDTFFLSNVCPQDAKFNMEYWNRFEKYVRCHALYYTARE